MRHVVGNAELTRLRRSPPSRRDSFVKQNVGVEVVTVPGAWNGAVVRLAREVIRAFSPLGLRSQTYVLLRLLTAPMIAIERHFPREGTILDLGCGHGIFAHIMLLACPSRSVLGIDMSAARIDDARRTATSSSLRFEVGKAQDFPQEQYSGIAIVDLLHHMTPIDQDQLLRRGVAALAPGAVLVVKDLERRPRWKYLFHYWQDLIMYGGPLEFLTRDDMVSRLEGMGLEVSVHPLARWRPYPHILYRCQKRNVAVSVR